MDQAFTRQSKKPSSGHCRAAPMSEALEVMSVVVRTVLVSSTYHLHIPSRLQAQCVSSPRQKCIAMRHHPV